MTFMEIPLQLYDRFDGVINTAGLGTSNFIQDEESFPIRGQVMRVSKK